MSFSETIYEFLKSKGDAPPAMQPWLEMSERVMTKTGFPPGLSKQELEDRFLEHSRAVQAVIPANRLHMFDVKDGWQPLCAFLGVPTPDAAFPRTNDRESFWKLVKGEA